jgi:hypothetical protein
MEVSLTIRDKVQTRFKTQQLHYCLRLQNQLNVKDNLVTEIKGIQLHLLVASLLLMGPNLKIKEGLLTEWVQLATKNTSSQVN